jgi:hypothetical protein
MRTLILPMFLILSCISVPASGQPAAGRAGPPLLPNPDRLAGYADIADLVLAAPIIVRATITRAQPLPRRQAGAVPPGRVRLAVTADITNLLAAPQASGGTLAWLWDAPADAQGKPPRARGMDILAFVAVPAAGGATRLVSTRAVQPFDPVMADQVRAILTEQRSGQVPVFTGVSNGFRADGTITGESESQFFLTSADGKPATLVVQNRPGERRRVAVARGDIIDDSAEAVRPASLLWYRLACFLPANLPAAAGGDDAALARDWRDALASLGPCGRTGQKLDNSTPTARQSG